MSQEKEQQAHESEHYIPEEVQDAAPHLHAKTYLVTFVSATLSLNVATKVNQTC